MFKVLEGSFGVLFVVNVALAVVCFLIASHMAAFVFLHAVALRISTAPSAGDGMNFSANAK